MITHYRPPKRRRSQYKAIKEVNKDFVHISVLVALTIAFFLIYSLVDWYKEEPKQLVRAYHVWTEYKPREPVLIEHGENEKDLQYYTVVDGDTLWSISMDLGVDLNRLIELNNFEEPYTIRIGEQLLY